MKNRKKLSLDCFGAKRLSDVLYWLGFGFMLLCGYLWNWSGDGRFGIGLAVGAVVAIAGALVGWLGIVCPRCGAPLYEFPRLPRRLPRYCPRCGDEILPEKDD